MGKAAFFMCLLVVMFGYYIFMPVMEGKEEIGMQSAVKNVSEEISVETICMDGKDNDGDGFTDDEDSDCWIREGALFIEEWRHPYNYSNYIKILPILKEIGVKTVVLLGIWEHCKKAPGYRWAVRNYSELDKRMGTEDELKRLIEEVHDKGMKIIVLFQTSTSLPPRKGICPDPYYDDIGEGGDLYKYQKEHPEKEILIRDEKGKFICHYYGWGYAVNRSSNDVIAYFKEVYDREIEGRGFDGIFLDSPIDNYCNEGDKIWRGCYARDCPRPINSEPSSLPLFISLKNLTPYKVFISENPYTKAPKTKWSCSFPFYLPETDMDIVAEASQDCGLPILIRTHIIKNKIKSEDFVKWVKNRPILYNRHRINGFRGQNTFGEALDFISKDERYFPMVTLISTIPGIPKVTFYELFGSKEIPDSMESAKNRREHWKKVLNIRNRNLALKYGSIENVWAGGDNTLAYMREYENERAIVVVNFMNKNASSILNLSSFDRGSVLYDALNEEFFMVKDPNNFKISVPANGSRILLSGIIRVPEDFQTIQEAINHVSADKRTIIVNASKYDAIESIEVNKSYVNIISEGIATVHAAENFVFKISNQRNVTIKGFRMEGAGGEHAAGILLINSSNCNISCNIITNITSIRNIASGIHLRRSNNNIFTNNSIINIKGEEARGISISKSSNGNIFSNTTIKDIYGGKYASAIHIKGVSNNTFASAIIENITAYYRGARGIFLNSSSSNNFKDIYIKNCNSNYSAYGVYLMLSDNNSFEIVNISATMRSDENISEIYDFYSDKGSAQNIVEELTLNNSTTLSFTYDKGIGMKGIVRDIHAPPEGKRGINKYIYIKNVSEESWISLRIRYNEDDVYGIKEDTLLLYVYNESVGCWKKIEGSGVNKTGRYVYGNISFGTFFGTISIFGRPYIWYVDDSGGGDFNIIQYAIDNASEGDTIIVYNGTYEESIEIYKQLNISGTDMPVVNAYDKEYAVIISANGCLLHGFKVINAKVAGIYIKSDHNNISNNDILSNFGDGMLILGDNNTILSNNVSHNYGIGFCIYDSNGNILSNNNASLNYRNGICLYSSNNNKILNNIVETSNMAGISMFYSHNNTILNNIITLNNNKGVYLCNSIGNNISSNVIISNNREGVYLNISNDNIILNNNISLNTDEGISMHKSDFNIVSGNTIDSNREQGIYLYLSHNNLISNNNINSNRDEGIYLWGSYSNTISNNIVNFNGEDGIFLWRAKNNTITDNTVFKNDDGIYVGRFSSHNTISNNNLFEQDDGIYFESSHNNTIIENEIYGNYNGVYIINSSTNIISCNNIYSNKFYGIHLYALSEHNILSSNNIYLNDFDGIYIHERSDCNTLYSNKIYLNDFDGIYIDRCYGNLLYHNNLINNSISVRDERGENRWYNESLNEGNYYSDYDGEDEDEDGVGDSPYIIIGSSRSIDLYPLMKPWSVQVSSECFNLIT